jgi:sarcosine oxidase, subunit gamma
MAEMAQRLSALAGLTLVNRVGEIAVTDAGAALRIVCRGAPDVLGDAFGIALPTEPMRTAATSDRTALWLGPDEWLLIARDDTALVQRLRAHLVGKPASLVDVSHRNVGLTLSGPRAADLLASACPLDFDLAAFPIGMCTRTIFGKAEAVLWRTAREAFRMETWRSFAPYVVALMAEAAAGLPAPSAQ